MKSCTGGYFLRVAGGGTFLVEIVCDNELRRMLRNVTQV